MKVAYLGPTGSYTEEAARTCFEQAHLVAVDTIELVFEAIREHTVERGVVPIENIVQGPVTETQDALYHSHEQVRVVDMLVVPIAHALGSVGNVQTIKRIYSKDQALKQCSQYLQQQFPHAELFEVDSTSRAMQRLYEAQDERQGAIGSKHAINQYGLNLIDENIGDVRDNQTRFAVLARPAPSNFALSGSDATALVICPPGNRVGMLEEILGVISRDHGLSLTSIHSRPDRRGGFRFYVELEGHVKDDAVQACVDALQEKLTADSGEIRVCGSYPRRLFGEIS